MRKVSLIILKSNYHLASNKRAVPLNILEATNINDESNKPKLNKEQELFQILMEKIKEHPLITLLLTFFIIRH